MTKKNKNKEALYCEHCKGDPTKTHIPNAETLAAMKDAKEGRNPVSYGSMADMFKELGL